MSYSIFIERDNAIEIEEWKSAIAKIDGVKLISGPIQGINPTTKATIEILSSDYDVAVLIKSGGFLGFGRKEEWVRAIFFSNGRAQIKATETIDSPKDPIRLAASNIAKILKAKIRGEADEIYNWNQ